LGRPAAPFAGHQLEHRRDCIHRSHQQRLQHALFTDRLSQRLEFGLVKPAARLMGAGLDRLDLHLAHRAGAGRSAFNLTEQRG
jgi:hypothetical protein